MSQETATGRGTSSGSGLGSLLVNPRDLRLRHQVGLVGYLLLFLVPLPLTAVQLSGVILVLYLMMFAMSWDFVSGYTGQISFGHTFFFTIGGYGAAILNVDYGIHPLASILVATLLAGVGGIILGVPALRLRGPYLSLVTLIAPLILLQIFIVRADIFRGTNGFTVQPDPIVATSQNAVVTLSGPDAFITSTIAQWYIAFFVFSVMLGLMYAITRSDAGDVFTAIREDEDTVASVGLSPAKFKIFAFVGSGLAGGLAGAMFAHSGAVGTVQPGNYLEIGLAIQVIIMTVIGGMGTIVGAAVGAAFFLAGQVALGAIPVTIPLIDKTPGELTPLPLFLVAILVLFFAPGGIVRAVTRRLDAMEADTATEVDDSETDPLEQQVEGVRERTKEKLRDLEDRL